MPTALLRPLLTDDDGQDLIEYSLLLTLIALGAVAAMQSVAQGVVAALSGVGSSMTSAI